MSLVPWLEWKIPKRGHVLPKSCVVYEEKDILSVYMGTTCGLLWAWQVSTKKIAPMDSEKNPVEEIILPCKGHITCIQLSKELWRPNEVRTNV